jgi:hypothetical protein
MALRKPQVDQAERLVRIADVLAEAGGVNPSRVFDEEAERLASAMVPRGMVSRDWSGRPCLSWPDGERMLLRMRRDQQEEDRARAERLAAADQLQALPSGTLMLETPGYTWTAPGFDPHERTGAQSGQVPG